MGARYDMYNNIHKALRRVLCELLLEAGVADLTVDGQARVVAGWHAVEAMLASHQQHEDRFIGPHLQRIAPALFARMERDHLALEQDVSSLTASAKLLAASPTSEHARCFHRGLARFVGHYFGHMAEEEGAYTLALQRAYSDRELLAIEAELVASIPAQALEAFSAVLLPSLNHAERQDLLERHDIGA